MWNFNNSDVSIEDIKKLVSDEDIYYHYLGDFEDNSWFSAPWRSDTSPSLRISWYNNAWVWVDFGEDPRPKSSIDFVRRLFNIGYKDALLKIYNDIVLNNNNNLISKKIIKNEAKSFCKIRKEFFPFEIEYWSKAAISVHDLLAWDIYSGEIRHNGIIWHTSKINDPLFIYMFDKHIPIYKGYRPFASEKSLKFYSKNISGHIQGYDKLPDGSKILIITKSYKDIIVWNKLGYPAIAPHSENMFISPFDLYELQTRFDYIYVNYDNDDVGVKKSIEYTSTYDLYYFNTPVDSCCKDVFEFVCEYSYNELDFLFKQKLERDETT